MEEIDPLPRKREPERFRSLVFVGVLFFCFVWGTFFVCGCHFHPVAAPAGFIPLPFSVYLLGSYQTSGGRVFAWLAFFLACGLFAMCFDGNLKFALF